MVFDPFGVGRLCVLVPFRAPRLDLLEVVIEGQGQVELIHLRILHSHDVVLLEQVLNRLFDFDELEKVNWIIRVVFGIEVALHNDIRLKFTNFCCQRCPCWKPLVRLAC